jgi:uncharacterized protein YjeT (DUF2065 family)
MTVQDFLFLLTAFSVISGLVTEAVKKLISDKTNLSYNILALCISLIVGSVGCVIYYQLNSIAYTVNNIIYIGLMSVASGLVAMLGFDR